jgi:GNAT superfamily N-acetyltransferase
VSAPVSAARSVARPVPTGVPADAFSAGRSGAAAGLIRLRQAAAADREALNRMFDRCTQQTRYRRFHGPVKAIPARYLTDALDGGPFHYALVACRSPDQWLDSGAAPAPGAGSDPDGDRAARALPDNSQGEGADLLVALASCRVTSEGAAELGVLIEDAWQRRGLGTRLVGDLVAHARRTGLRVLEAQLLAEQAWITGLLRPHGTCRLGSSWNGVLSVTIRLSE